MAFFTESTTTSKQPTSLLPKCGACGLLNSCQSPKMAVSGKGRRGILIIGEAPGPEEDDRGTQFVGASGQYLRQALYRYDIDLDRDCWKTNAIICRPKKAGPSNDQIEYCRPNLVDTIRELNPRLIIPLGFSATKSLLVPYFREAVGKVATWVGWQIPLQKINTWVCPNYHPDLVMKAREDRNGPVVKLLFERYLENAANLLGRPWEVVPDYPAQARAIYDEDEAIAWIRRCVERGLPTSFDWETNALKPEAEGARLVSAGLFQAGEGVAFMVTPRLVKALHLFCKSDVPKIGANNKFEDRWARAVLGTPVANWVWDCMLSAHHLDNRPDICSVKFQVFVQLGFEPWDSVVKPYFQSEHAMVLNRVEEIDARTLLMYNALDAVVEFHLAKKQKEIMKWQNVV